MAKFSKNPGRLGNLAGFLAQIYTINRVDWPGIVRQKLRKRNIFLGFNSLNSFAHFGNDGENGSRAFDGLIDDARVYDRALTAQEIANLPAN